MSPSCSPSLSTVSFYQNFLTFRQGYFFLHKYYLFLSAQLIILSLLILGPADPLQLGLHAAGHSLHPCSVQLQLHPSHLCCGELLNNNNNRQVVLIKTILAWILWLLCYHLHVPVDQRPLCRPLHYSPAPRPGCSVYTGA